MGIFEKSRDKPLHPPEGSEHSLETQRKKDIERVYGLLQSRQSLSAVFDAAMFTIDKTPNCTERIEETPSLPTILESPDTLRLERQALEPFVDAIGHPSDEPNAYAVIPTLSLSQQLRHDGRPVHRLKYLVLIIAVVAVTTGFGFLSRIGTHQEPQVADNPAPNLSSTMSETGPLPRSDPAPATSNQTVPVAAPTSYESTRNTPQTTPVPEGIVVESRASFPDLSPLLRRGDSLLAAGDVASARLFYERAADAGDAQGALKLGEAYDPIFLTRINSIGVRGDVTIATRWYRRAAELGASEAELLLKSVGNR